MPDAAPAAAHSVRPLPPGPRGHWLLGMMPEIRKDPLGFRLRLLQEHGEIVRYRFLGGSSVALYHPEHLKHVLVDRHHNYRKDFLRGGSFETLMGNGLLASNGELWKRQRRLAQPAFHRDRLAAMGPLMTAAALEMVQRWQHEDARELDAAAEMMRVTLRIAGETLFGQDLSHDASEIGRGFTRLLEEGLFPSGPAIVYFMIWRALSFLPRPRNRVFDEEYAKLIRLVAQIVEDRRREGGDRNDLLSMFLAVRDEETGAGMDAAQLRDELITMLLAGHETTANALSWTLYLLSQHPSVEQRLHAEVDEVLQGRPPAPADLRRLEYTSMVLRESMRLYPPAPAFTRSALADDEIGPYRIPAGTTVVISPYAMHRHPRYWQEPDVFDPERFRPELEKELPHFVYLPFGAGPRRCIGHQFAMMEGQLVLAAVAQRFRLRLKPGHTVRADVQVTLRPRGGLPMLLEPRA
jgi:cytochrome P450